MARLLVVEPEEAVRHFMEVILRQAGHEMVAGVSCASRLDPQVQGSLDLILCDVGFLNKSDEACIIEVRRRFPNAKILGISAAIHDQANPDGVHQTQARDGMAGILSKPFTIPGLVRAVDLLLSTDH